MGFFSSIVHSIGDIAKAPIDAVSSIFGGGGGDKGNDNMSNMINDQIKAYKQQTELTNQQLNETRAQTDATKRAVQEKQIRALRGNYRAAGAGLLGVGKPATEDTSNKLGG